MNKKLGDASDVIYDPKTEVVILDFDGTLVDSTERVFISAYFEVLREMGIKPSMLVKPRLLMLIGEAKKSDDFWRYIVRKLNEMHKLDRKEDEEIMQRAKEKAKPKLKEMRPREGAFETVDDIIASGKEVAVCASSMDVAVDAILARNFLKKCKVVITADKVPGTKAVALKETLGRLDCEPKNCVLVADKYTDFSSAEQVGIIKGVGFKNPGLKNIKNNYKMQQVVPTITQFTEIKKQDKGR